MYNLSPEPGEAGYAGARYPRGTRRGRRVAGVPQLRRRPPQGNDARQGLFHRRLSARRARHRDQSSAHGQRRMGRGPSGHHRAKARRGRARAHGALRRADRPRQSRAVPGEGERSAGAHGEPWRAVLDPDARPRPLQGGQRLAWTCDRRLAAEGGRRSPAPARRAISMSSPGSAATNSPSFRSPASNQRDQATVLANRILSAITEPYDIDGRKIVIGTSIGITLAPQDADAADADADILVRRADLALYKSKSEGRNRYRFFQAAMEAEARDRRELEEDMRRALLREEFELHYQTVIDVGQRECCGAEALVRWRHPKRGLLCTRSVHQPGRGERPDHAARRLDPAARLFRRRELAGASQDRRQSLAGAAQAGQSPGSDQVGAQGVRPRARPAGARNHRDRAGGKERGESRAPARDQESRDFDRAGRFRHRLLVDALSCRCSRSTGSRSTSHSSRA